MFDTGPLYKVLCESDADIDVLQGGTDSGKTVAAIQFFIVVACYTRPPLQDPIITVLNESVPNSKKGAYRIAKSFYDSNAYFRSCVKDFKEGERVIYFKNGWVMEFLGATDEQNAKQGKRQYLFVNEANGISWPIFWQMAKRTRIKVVIDYNPSAPFWAHENLIGTLPDGNDLGMSVRLTISDHRHNPYLTDKQHAQTENIKDPERWKVYARGMTGNLSGIIFPNWKQIDDKNFPWNESLLGGLDFGYTNDPTAGVLIAVIANNVYVHELCYEPGLTPLRLAQLYKAHKFNDEQYIYCEHDPDITRQLRALELMAIPAVKGKGSIKAGIMKLNEYNVYYTTSSKNIAFERAKYMWEKDPLTGKLTNVPTEVDNHLMDAIRYGVYSRFCRSE